MITILVALMLFASTGIMFGIGTYYHHDVILAISVFFFAAAVLNTISCICNHVREYNEIVCDIAEVTRLQETKKINKRQADELLADFKLYLGDKYPAHEKEIFRLLSQSQNGKSINVIGKFPEIESSEVLKALVGKIKELSNSIYSADREVEKCLKDIRVRRQNPYYLSRVLPLEPVINRED